ncbi:MAG: hypothetical protein K9J30_10675 [Bacteroidales bacterium]|nr:hypothetical protein [Bacteroidales bacterium]
MKNPQTLWAYARPGIIIPVFFFAMTRYMSAQQFFPDARSAALGNISSVASDGSLHTNNPAILGKIKDHTLSAGHARPFATKEIGFSSLTGIMKTGHGAFQLRFSNYGIGGFQNFSSKLAYGIRLSDKLGVGVSFHYYNTMSQGEWNYLWTLGLGGGIYYRVLPTTVISSNIGNPVTSGNHPDNAPLFPYTVSAGVSHLIYTNTTLLCELSVVTPERMQFRQGLEFLFGKTTVIRAGYHSEPNTYSFGAGFTFERTSLDLSFSWTANRGITPAILVSYNPGK